MTPPSRRRPKLSLFLLLTTNALLFRCAQSVKSGGVNHHFVKIRRRVGSNLFGIIQTSKTKTIRDASTQVTETTTTTTTGLSELANVFQPDNIMDENDGSIDLPKLLHACRTFELAARQMGKKQSARDLAGNIHKIEEAMSRSGRDYGARMAPFLKWERDVAGIHQTAAPTKDVAAASYSGIYQRGGGQEEEFQQSHHNNNIESDSSCQLADPSGAMGLLWIRRTISFQHCMYRQLLENDGVPPVQAANVAYKRELEPYHGAMLRRFYRFAVKGKMPQQSSSFLARLGGFEEDSFGPQEQQAVRNDMQRLVDSWEPLLEKWKQTFEELGMEDTRPV